MSEHEYTFKVKIRSDGNGTHDAKAYMVLRMIKPLVSRTEVAVSRRELSAEEIEALNQADRDKEMEKLRTLGQKP